MFGQKKSEAHTKIELRESELLDRLEDVARELAEVRGTFDGAKHALGLSRQVKELRESIASLEIDKSKITEQHERERRETEHMVGLQRKRGEFEIDAAKRAAVLDVREENLKAERAEFERQQAFRQEQFDGQVAYLQELMGQILKRLPTIGVDLSGDAKPVVGDKPAPRSPRR